MAGSAPKNGVKRIMKQTKKLLEQEEGNVVPFEKPTLIALPGGKEEDPNNWLRNVTEGYIIHTRQKNVNAVGCMVCQVLQHFDKTTICYDLLNKVTFCVYTRTFSS